MDWYVVVLHGNIYQSGMPDLFACHKNYGIRLIEVKNPKNYSFTAAQLEVFPRLMSHGVGVYILTSAEDQELNKLFQPANWFWFLDQKMMRQK